MIVSVDFGVCPNYDHAIAIWSIYLDAAYVTCSRVSTSVGECVEALVQAKISAEWTQIVAALQPKYEQRHLYRHGSSNPSGL